MTVTDTEIRDGCAAIAATFEDRRTLRGIANAVTPSSKWYFLGCGSSYWVASAAATSFRGIGCDSTAVTGSAFYFDEYPVDEATAVVAYSQSGETTETVRAMEAAAAEGARTIAITNSAGSTLARTAEQSYVTPSGTEQSVLATKSVDAAMVASLLLAGAVGEEATEITWSADTCRTIADRDLQEAVETFRDACRTYTLGTGIDYALAGEAARKFGEGPLIHSTPMPAMEISHGPLANVSGDPVLLVVSDPAMIDHYESLLEELRDAGAHVVAIHPEGTALAADASITVPAGTPQFLYTLKAIQRLTFVLARDRDIDPDQPPAISKHVERSDL